jgi:hypothetical protein
MRIEIAVLLMSLVGCTNHIDLTKIVYLVPDQSFKEDCPEDSVTGNDCYLQRLDDLVVGFYSWFKNVPEEEKPEIRILFEEDTPDDSNTILISVKPEWDDETAGRYYYRGWGPPTIRFTRSGYYFNGLDPIVVAHEFGHAFMIGMDADHVDPKKRLSIMNTPGSVVEPTSEDVIEMCKFHSELKYCQELRDYLPSR